MSLEFINLYCLFKYQSNSLSIPTPQVTHVDMHCEPLNDKDYALGITCSGNM